MAINLGLSRIQQLLNYLGNPHLRLCVIHIAGTNGKGSVSAYLDSILVHGGLKTGRFNSPHLITLRDSIQLSGEVVHETIFSPVFQHIHDANLASKANATPFELLTATAFTIFAETIPPVDVAIIEVGMGGRDDATNVVPQPLLTLFTSIDLDHKEFLGDTVEDIALVKAGIIKERRPCIVAPQKSTTVTRVLREVATKRNAPFFLVSKAIMGEDGKALFHFGLQTIAAELPLQGDHQLENSSLAVTAVSVLNNILRRTQTDCVPLKTIASGLEATQWPGRLDWVSYSYHGNLIPILVDGAHNSASSAVLCDYLTSLQPVDTTFFIVALTNTKRPSDILRTLVGDNRSASTIIATRFSCPVEGMPWVSPLDTSIIEKAAIELGLSTTSSLNLEEALDLVMPQFANQHTRIVVAGSLYLVADLYRSLGRQ